MNARNLIIYGIVSLFLLGVKVTAQTATNVSGIYPSIAFYDNEGECGTGAVVPWAGKLWVVTYAPHAPFGSSNKLYEISPDMTAVVRPESIGGTPANRMIHRESNQLFIGPYVISAVGNVRALNYKDTPGRYTGLARSLTDPADKILLATMEEGFYEIDVHSLATKLLYADANTLQKKGEPLLSPLLPGYHGKGFYSGQGVAVYANNGELSDAAMKHFNAESGSLCEWNGTDWKLIRRNQFTEVTGPGGIYGNAKPKTDPIWTIGWDYKSLLFGVRDAQKGWSFYRLPKASHSYDGAHGWNTEWPRIRNVGTDEKPDYLMTMHGMFWRFPKSFTASNTAGIRPRSAYLKVIGDFCNWNGRLVFGCDDSAQSEFLNKRSAKGNIAGPGQSNSNLWFTTTTKPDELGPATAEGAVWHADTLQADEVSDPFLFNGWNRRCCWLSNLGNDPASFTFEIDEAGNGDWKALRQFSLKGKESVNVGFSPDDQAEWIRIRTNHNTIASACFSYTSDDMRTSKADNIFQGLASASSTTSNGGLLYSLGNDRRALGFLSGNNYYELDGNLNLKSKVDTMAAFIRKNLAIPKNVISIESSSVLIKDDAGHRWRLPLGNDAFRSPNLQGKLRVCREVATERDLFSCMGTFYELPAENAGGYAKIRPISTHNFRIGDYASYRGMLVMTGVELGKANNPHIIKSDDHKAALWVGTIDDLWSLGKPVGHGGPWLDSEVKAYVPSDPYLIGYYDKKTLMITHQSAKPVQFKVEVDPTGDGDWLTFGTYIVESGQNLLFQFPESFQARWIRFTADSNVKATAWLEYR